jgi:hypothetical protein
MRGTPAMRRRVGWRCFYPPPAPPWKGGVGWICVVGLRVWQTGMEGMEGDGCGARHAGGVRTCGMAVFLPSPNPSLEGRGGVDLRGWLAGLADRDGGDGKSGVMRHAFGFSG